MNRKHYDTIRRRSTKTLARWWHELNCWRWVKELDPPEDPDVEGTPRRQEYMAHIESVVAFRAMKPYLKDLS